MCIPLPGECGLGFKELGGLVGLLEYWTKNTQD